MYGMAQGQIYGTACWMTSSHTQFYQPILKILNFFTILKSQLVGNKQERANFANFFFFAHFHFVDNRKVQKVDGNLAISHGHSELMVNYLVVNNNDVKMYWTFLPFSVEQQ